MYFSFGTSLGFMDIFLLFCTCRNRKDCLIILKLQESLTLSNTDCKLLVRKFIEPRKVIRLLIVIAMEFFDERGTTFAISIYGNMVLVKYGSKRCESYPKKYEERQIDMAFPCVCLNYTICVLYRGIWLSSGRDLEHLEFHQ